MQYSAAKLKAVGTKEDIKNPTGQKYIIPQGLADIVFGDKKLTPSAKILFMVLNGTKQDVDFELHQQWLLDRTGLSKKGLTDARAKLVECGYIEFEERKFLTIRYDNIAKMGDMGNESIPEKVHMGNKTIPEKSTQQNMGNKTIPEMGNKTIPEMGNKTIPIIDNIINKERDNLEQDYSHTVASGSEEPPATYVNNPLPELSRPENQELKEQKKEEKVMYMSAVKDTTKQSQPQPKRPDNYEAFKNMFNADGSFKF